RSSSPGRVAPSVPVPTSTGGAPTAESRTKALPPPPPPSGTHRRRRRRRSVRWRSPSWWRSTASAAARGWTSTTGDIVIASEREEFFYPHVSIGLVSGREMVRLARAVPANVAMRMALLGKHERVSAQRAFDLGLITEIV